MNKCKERNTLAYKRKHQVESRKHYLDNKQYYLDRNAKVIAAKRAYLNAVKEGVGCLDCRQKLPACALDFDHRDPAEKEMDVSRLVTFGWARLKTEVEKCDVRCANCHRIKHWKVG